MDINKLGIELSLSPDTLVALTKAYEERVAKLKGSLVTSSGIIADLRRELSDQWSEDETLTEFLSELQSSLLEFIEQNPTASVALFEGIAELRALVKDERDYYLTVEMRKQKPTIQADDSLDSLKTEAVELKSMVKSMFDLLDGMKMLPPNYKVATTKAGVRNPDIPRVPTNRIGGGGRASKERRLSLWWEPVDGDLIEFDEDTWIVDVIHGYINTLDQRWSSRDIFKALRDDESVDPFDGEPHSLEFDHGTLTVQLCDEVDEEEADDDDEDDE